MALSDSAAQGEVLAVTRWVMGSIALGACELLLDFAFIPHRLQINPYLLGLLIQMRPLQSQRSGGV